MKKWGCVYTGREMTTRLAYVIYEYYITPTIVVIAIDVSLPENIFSFFLYLLDYYRNRQTERLG